ncbi:Related to G-protein coupled receptors [Ectocarpus siliculosus]|uniref:Related to G-protein coupled receptors n=1 Tax=Ectocarpus siliculosus TaxID=2880 RepID=D8LGC7_ECTSI|nr:Related to G-protein coupled receptors [Ectocarpus siliculosus]|eukprot:CBN79026.1 Related to G-protein coupled receptors [Ectocarpus siliculosus]
MMLAVANLGIDSAYLMGSVGHANWKCSLQGFGRVYFALVEFALVTAITLTCYVMVVKRYYGIQERFWTVMAYCWLIPLGMACLPFTTDNYGEAGAWCSITSKDLKSLEWGTFWRFAVIYVPLVFEAAMVAYVEPGHETQAGGGGSSVASTGAGGTHPAAEAAAPAGGGGARTGPGGVETSTSIPIIERLRLYPIVLVVCWSWATVNRTREAIEPYAESLFWLFILQYSFQSIQGFLNLMIFLRTPGVMEEWRDDIKKWSCGDCCWPFRRVRTVDRAGLLDSSSTSSLSEPGRK